MDLKEFQDDFKFFMYLGMYASGKLVTAYGKKLIKAAKVLKYNKYVGMAEAVADIGAFNIRSARSRLEKLHLKYPEDGFVEVLLNFVRTIILKSQDTGTVANKKHEKLEEDIKHELTKLMHNKEENVAALAKICKEKL